MADACQLLRADDQEMQRNELMPFHADFHRDSADWPSPISGGRRSRWDIARWRIPDSRADSAAG